MCFYYSRCLWISRIVWSAVNLSDLFVSACATSACQCPHQRTLGGKTTIPNASIAKQNDLDNIVWRLQFVLKGFSLHQSYTRNHNTSSKKGWEFSKTDRSENFETNIPATRQQSRGYKIDFCRVQSLPSSFRNCFVFLSFSFFAGRWRNLSEKTWLFADRHAEEGFRDEIRRISAHNVALGGFPQHNINASFFLSGADHISFQHAGKLIWSPITPQASHTIITVVIDDTSHFHKQAAVTVTMKMKMWVNTAQQPGAGVSAYCQRPFCRWQCCGRWF